MIAIVDYGMGNLRSVANVIDYCGKDPVVTASAQELADASHIILPGVGAFGEAINRIEELGLIETLSREVLEKGKPMLGLCLGMQLLGGSSDEHGYHRGLGWFDSEIVRMSPGKRHLKIPHMGWNTVRVQRDHPILKGFAVEQLIFYFVHSYHMVCRAAENVIGVFDYGDTFTAIIARDNIFATQFHPEKSQDSGLQLLTNFLGWRA